MKKGLRLIFIFVAMITFSMASSGWAATLGLIENGDFEEGNTGFNTDFTFKDDLWAGGPPYDHSSGIWPQGTYNVASDPSPYHPNAASYGDHTSGEGNMMMVNGSTSGAISVVWAQNVFNIDTSKKYEFSVWSSTWADLDLPGLFAVLINGEVLASGGESQPALGVWEEASLIWTPTVNDFVAQIAILNTSNLGRGNDFALDDISFQVVPIPQTVWLFGTALLFLIGLKRKSSS